MTEVLSIDVIIDDSHDVAGKVGNARMISFHGESNCDNFKGKILPGGVDTQKYYENGEKTLSARYILDGKDFTGEHCRIFIENNGIIAEDGSITTKPVIFTDSEALKWLETANLMGSVEGTRNGVRISIMMV